jgi:regulator of protease activity HflC (stomatin/prohibitin superfamily)
VKRAKILQSEGLPQSAVNVADGDRQAAIKEAEGQRQAAILRAEGERQALILEAEGRAQAIATVHGAIRTASPDPTLVAILQLDTLAKFAASPNTKIVIPAESSALLGAAQAIQSVLAQVPAASE